MTLYKYVGKNTSNRIGVGEGRDGGINIEAYSWTGENPDVELTTEQAQELIRIIKAHLQARNDRRQGN